MRVGECLIGGGANAAHVKLMIGIQDVPLGAAFATAAASPARGHFLLLTVLKPTLPT